MNIEPATFLDRLLWCETSLDIQVSEALIIACIMSIVFPPSVNAMNRLFKTRPWFEQALKHLRDVTRDVFGQDLDDEVITKSLGQLAIIAMQHFSGGVLGVPAALGGLGLPKPVVYALLRHGVLMELGWEIQDTCDRFWERFLKPKGAILQPWTIMKLVLIHHSMQIFMVIPMNLYYSEISGYSELVVMLEFAGGISSFTSLYSHTLDSSKKNEVFQLAVGNAVCLAVIVYSRMVHYWWSVFKVMRLFYTSGAYLAFLSGIVLGLFAMPWIAVKLIPSLWKRTNKFTTQYLEMAAGAPAAETGDERAKEHKE